ncbi:putative vesicular-fusion protein sec17 [Sordaria brevicollis]|uniref:Vesicular-fusion protein sec17 n=1 Tax=Sordaria brevicollis TaxID=83679 RepID=A0AAE0PC47_SORBR|nr:putative vesicular-fusion protein sec17 [Sordaria brevicollis]
MAVDPRVLQQEAEKTLASASKGWGLFSNKEDKYQNAADQYVQAANAYRLQKSNKEAGKCFEEAAKIFTEKLKEPNDAANAMLDAFKVYRKDAPDSAVRCVEAAIKQYTMAGNFRRAASHKENQAEVYENELDNKPEAIKAYTTAAEWYENDGAVALANKLWLKVADLSALAGDYFGAIEKFEKVADASLGNNLMRYSVKEYFLKAGLCSLATKDMVTAQRNIAKYAEKDPSFGGQREYQLLVDLLEAASNNNLEMFQDKLAAYDKMSRLDDWKAAVLLHIKNNFEEADNEFS